VTGPSSAPIPDDVRRFIVEAIDSIPALEALLLMRRDPGQHWTTGMLAAALYMEPKQVAPFLSDLASRGLCGTADNSEPRYFWRPATPDLAQALDRLADVYARHLVAVTNLIHSKPRPSVRGFSDAFRIRGTE